MRGRAISLLTVSGVLICLCYAQDDFLPFLSLSTAPVSLPYVDNAASEAAINIPINFPFGGVLWDTVYVGTNGVFSFGTRLTQAPGISAFTPSSSQTYVVAPYWTDIDRGVGEYEVHSSNVSASGVMLEQVSSFIREQTGEMFSGTWMVVALWFQAEQFIGSETNTFQGVLITDGTSSYAVFTYECGKLEWARTSTVIGFKAESYYRNYPVAGGEALNVACVDNAPNTNWRNLVYKLDSGDICSLISGYGCNNGDCVDISRRCDNVEDCSDGSDEIACTCPVDNFRCSDGQCISAEDRCDIITQCTDDSDEENCPCESYEFECDNGNCISEAAKCNDFDDCDDNSDEDGCVNLGLAIGLSVAGFVILVFIAVPCGIFLCGSGKYSRVAIAARFRRSETVPATTAVYTTTHEEEEVNFDPKGTAFGSPAQEPPPPNRPTTYPASGYEAPPPYASAATEGSYVPHNTGYSAYPPQPGYPVQGGYPAGSDGYRPYPYPTAPPSHGPGAHVSFPTEPR